MAFTFECWTYEKKETISAKDIWKKESIPYVKRAVGYASLYEPIQGYDEEGIFYCYDTVQVLLYLNEIGRQVSVREFIPFYDGDEIRNVEIPASLEHQISMQLRNYPVTA